MTVVALGMKPLMGPSSYREMVRSCMVARYSGWETMPDWKIMMASAGTSSLNAFAFLSAATFQTRCSSRITARMVFWLDRDLPRCSLEERVFMMISVNLKAARSWRSLSSEDEYTTVVSGMRTPLLGSASLSSRASLLCAARDLSEPRDVSRFLRHNNRAFGSLPFHIATLPANSPEGSLF